MMFRLILELFGVVGIFACFPFLNEELFGTPVVKWLK